MQKRSVRNDSEKFLIALYIDPQITIKFAIWLFMHFEADFFIVLLIFENLFRKFSFQGWLYTCLISYILGIPAYQIISLAAQCLASSYKKQVDNCPVLQQQQQQQQQSSSYYPVNYPSQQNFQNNTPSYSGREDTFFLGIQ